MDRFTTYLLAAMAVLLAVAGGVAYFSRSPEPTRIVKPAADLTPTPKPASPFSLALPGDPAGAPDLLNPGAIANPAVTPASPLAPAAVPMPTPVPYTPPNPGKTQTLIFPGFTVVYSPALGSPLAAQYAMVGGAKPKRYPPAPKIATPNPRLIPAAGYARGPMALPSSIGLYFGKSSVPNTELMTNIAPMNPTLLGGPWSEFAALEQRWAGEFTWIEVVAGPIFNSPPSTAGGLVIPAAFFRAYRRSYGDAIAFIIPQDAVGNSLKPFLTSISSVEAATGLDIFPNTLDLTAREQVAPAVW